MANFQEFRRNLVHRGRGRGTYRSVQNRLPKPMPVAVPATDPAVAQSKMAMVTAELKAIVDDWQVLCTLEGKNFIYFDVFLFFIKKNFHF